MSSGSKRSRSAQAPAAAVVAVSMPLTRDALATPAVARAHPFACDPRDHAETPLAAYGDVAPLLDALASRIRGRDRSTLALYDPYFCEGGVLGRLASLGFSNVRNENVDFYAPGVAEATPFDVLLTNPPFSGDHIERCLRFCARSGKPWLVLIPDFVFRKRFFFDIFGPERAASSAAGGGSAASAAAVAAVATKALVSARGGGGGESGSSGGAKDAVNRSKERSDSRDNTLCRRDDLFFVGPRDAPYVFLAPTTTATTAENEGAASLESKRGDVAKGASSGGRTDHIDDGAASLSLPLHRRRRDGAAATCAATAAADAPAPAAPIALGPGKFQCVWFGGGFQIPREQLAEAAEGGGGSIDFDDPRLLPRHVLAARPTPAMRRFAKKFKKGGKF